MVEEEERIAHAKADLEVKERESAGKKQNGKTVVVSSDSFASLGVSIICFPRP